MQRRLPLTPLADIRHYAAIDAALPRLMPFLALFSLITIFHYATPLMLMLPFAFFRYYAIFAALLMPDFADMFFSPLIL